jgi:hypothetical protein
MILQVNDVEYRPQRGFATLALFRACLATVITVILVAVGFQIRVTLYVAPLPAVVAIGWFAAYAAARRRRTRLTAAGIESRRLRTRSIAWAQIRDIQVVSWETVAAVPVRGNRISGRQGSRSGSGSRKVDAIRVQLANGRWRELAMPVVKENAHDPDFTSKAKEIRGRWRAATGQLPVG